MRNWKLIVTYLIIFLINISLTGFFEVTIKRPIIYYEYVFLPIILILVKRHFYRTILLIGLILLDLFYNLSHLYYFDLFNYVEKIPFLFISNFNFWFWIFIIIGLFVFIWLSNYLISLFELGFKEIQGRKKNIYWVLSFSIFCSVYIVDSLNGSSLIGTLWKGKHPINIRTENKREYNLGKSLINEVYKDYSLYELGKKQVHELADFKNIKNDSSIAYKDFYFSEDKKEIVIVLESWGLNLNDALFKAQIAPFYNLDTNRFKVDFEKSYFLGATVQAESRELLNKEGEAYFSVINHNECDIKSLIKNKAEHGYKTLAVQPFPGSYSLGKKFKKLIGFSSFKDYKYFHDTLGLINNQNNHYSAVNDEDVFSYIFNNQANPLKTFTYCLTINTHLPFSLSNQEKKSPDFIKFQESFKNQFPTSQSLEEYYRMKQELTCLAKLINKSNVDKILIIGDHAPPFLFEEERQTYSTTFVPSILFEKKETK